MQIDSVYKDMKESERNVAEYLKKLNVFWIFESPVFVYDEKQRPRVWTPDFYLPEWGIYIEVCGSEDFNYEYRQKIYFDNGVFVVFIHLYKEGEKWKTYLRKRIMEIEEYRHSKVMKMIESLLSSK